MIYKNIKCVVGRPLGHSPINYIHKLQSNDMQHMLQNDWWDGLHTHTHTHIRTTDQNPKQPTRTHTHAHTRPTGTQNNPHAHTQTQTFPKVDLVVPKSIWSFPGRIWSFPGRIWSSQVGFGRSQVDLVVPKSIWSGSTLVGIYFAVAPPFTLP